MSAKLPGMTEDGMIENKAQKGVTIDGYTSRVADRKGAFLVPPPVSTEAAPELPATVLVTMRDVVAAADQESGVYAIADPLLLEAVMAYPSLTLGSLTVIQGYPSSVYDHHFKEATFALPTISYTELLLDVASARRAEAAMQADMRHKPEVRDELTTRESGYKKMFSDFEVHGLAQQPTGGRSSTEEIVDEGD